MSDWWEKAYPGGPMVGPPLIRPLYPPDASSRGKKPSEDGKDVEAIKRAVCRGGHWPGPMADFDRAFSNGFSHGKGPNVSENGLAGVQRQNGLDPTGWMGEGTFNLLRSARIPEGLPNAGDPLLDATAIDLLEDYRKAQSGGDSTLRAAALKKAIDQLGYKESPSGSNANMFGSWYGMNYEPWCAMFVTWCYETAGGSPSYVKGSRYSYCPYMLSDAKNRKYGLSVVGEPKPGDAVLYDWERNGEPDHVGIFEKWTGGRTFNAIEGNTSTSNNSNGGQVMRRSRDAGGTLVHFIRAEEP